MKRLILSLFCLGAALTASAQAVRPVSTAQAAPGVAQRYVDLVTSSDLFIDGQVGVLAVTVGGDTLVPVVAGIKHEIDFYRHGPALPGSRVPVRNHAGL